MPGMNCQSPAAPRWLRAPGSKELSTKGINATSPGRPGPVVIYDIDQDGKSEVICFFADTDLLSGNTATDPWDMSQMELLILEGQTGEIKHRAKPEVLERCDAYIDGELHLSNYIHHRLMVANFSGNPQAQDFVVKPVAPILRDITMFSGNTILGDGSVVMILDPNGLATSVGEIQTAKTAEARDDRFVAAIDVREDSQILAYVVRAVTAGEFVFPGAVAEDMYRPDVYARSPAERLIIAGNDG